MELQTTTLNRVFRWVQYIPLAGMLACQDLTTPQSVGGNADPRELKNAEAAYGIANWAITRWQKALGAYIVISGLMTDELQAVDRNGTPNFSSEALSLDSRVLYSDIDDQVGIWSPYSDLHAVRGFVMQAVGALAKYASDSSAVEQAKLLAYMGYAEIMLADIYCSGIPLSTWDFEADYTLAPGSPRDDVYKNAIRWFDSAMALHVADSGVNNLAKLGKGRALLALGQFAQAVDAVQGVPTDFVFSEPLYACATLFNKCADARAKKAQSIMFDQATVSSREGGQPLIWPGNPRTRATQVNVVQGFPVYFPDKFVREGVSNVIFASGKEAGLIRAEAALHRGDFAQWRSELNTLRAQDPATDTMAAIVDPGDARRVDTLFAERAQWLFLTGNRQGDLRRRLRQYPGTRINVVYPSGRYSDGRLYGSDVTLPIDREFNNPFFSGCLNRDP